MGALVCSGYWWFRFPPSGLNPQHAARASRSVDLPLPFSPTKSVTFESKVISMPRLKAGMVKGKQVRSAAPGSTRAARRNGLSLVWGAVRRFATNVVNHASKLVRNGVDVLHLKKRNEDAMRLVESDEPTTQALSQIDGHLECKARASVARRTCRAVCYIGRNNASAAIVH